MLKKFKKEIILGILFTLIYLPVFFLMWDRWFARDSYYTHGIFIPFVSAFLVWEMRAALKQIPRRESPWGMALIILGLLAYWISSVLRIYFVGAFSMLIVFYGLVLYLYGGKIFARLMFPLAFLIFMVPLPMVVITNISFRLKLFAAQIAAWVLNSMHIFAEREGSIIKMKGAYVVVDDVCSGLRSLISLTALGSIFAYWMKTGMIKRLLLFASTIPIAVITNVCRVVILSAISDIWGAEYARGFVHDFTGFLVFAIAFVLLYAVKKVLE